MCVAICSFIEGKLQSICAKIAKDFNLEMKPGKHYIPYYLGFLNGRYSMKMANFKVFKTQFNQLQSLRDKCTHQDGKIDKIQEREFSNVEGILIKKLGDNLQLEVTTEYLRSLISDIKKFSNNLFSAIDERYVVINSKNNESQKNIIL